MSRIMQVFYGNDCLPYKDKDRQVHFPIVGSGLIGSSNVNELRFYVRDIGGVNDVAWVVVAKLPNGRQVFQVLSTIVLDTEINEYYLKLPIASAFTQLKGKVYFSLNGYRGNVSISTDSQTNIQTIVVAPGSQQIMTTGTVDISFNYSVVRAQGEELGVDQFTKIMTALADKSNIANTIQVVDSIVNVTTSDYENGQIFYALDDKKYWQLYVDENEARFMYLFDNVGSLNKELQLCRYDFSDFLTATVQHIFNDLFHSNYFIAKDGSGNEIICRIRARIGVPPVYDIYGFGVDDDGKLFTKTILNRDSSYTIGAFFVDTYHKTSFVNYIDESNILYGNSNINKVIGVLFGTPVYEGFVVQRDSGGQINLPETPVLDVHAASKKYVDDKVKEFGQLSIQEVDISTYPTLNSFLASTGQEGYEYYYPIDTTEAPTFTSGYYRYVWENNTWLSLGTTQVDLSNYVPYTGATRDVNLGNKTLKSVVVYAKSSVQFGDSDNNKQAFLTTPLNYDDDTDWSARLTKRNGSTTPIADLKFPRETGMLATREHVSTYYVPYTGATSNVDLGNHTLRANFVHVGKDSTDSLAITSPKIAGSIDYSALFTKIQSNNLVSQVKLPIRTGFVAMQEDLDSTNVELNKLKAMFYETTVDIIPYEFKSTYEFDLPSAINYQPVIFSAGADVEYIEGNSYAVNQLNNTPTAASLPAWGSIANFNVVTGNKYLIIMDFTRASEDVTTDYSVYMVGMASSTMYNITGGNKTTYLVVTAEVTGACDITTATYDTYQGNCGYDCRVINLTQMFGSNDLIPQDLLSNPNHFFNYYNGSLAYNVGTIVNSQPTSITSIGANLLNYGNGGTDNYYWTDNGDFIEIETPLNVSYLSCQPNKTYTIKGNQHGGSAYIRVTELDSNGNWLRRVLTVNDSQAHTFTTLPNTATLDIRCDETSNNYFSEIMLNQGSSALSYKPYQANTYPITTNVLRSAGNVKDNTQIQKVGAIDGSNTNWYYDDYNKQWYSDEIADGYEEMNSFGKVLAEKYAFDTEGYPTNATTHVRGILGKRIYVIDVSDSTEPSGVFNYQLQTPISQSPSSVVPTDLTIVSGGACEITYDSGNDTPCDMVLKLATSKIVEE